ncbi:MAG: RNA polymerase factor sigma-54 [Prevotella sp.]|nr:RNA polymerase factor sigma-54 [Prevotella sp.]
MAKQTIGQTERQIQRQKQKLTPLQLLIGQMIEKPIDQLTDYVNQQLIDNPALEVKADEDEWDMPQEPDFSMGGDEEKDDDKKNKEKTRESDFDTSDMDSFDDNELPVYELKEYQDPSNPISFYDKLREQVGELSLTDRQKTIMEYLIGSLDNDGLLRKDLYTINDEMAIYQYFDTTVEEIAEVLQYLQQFDPAGIGAQNLQQCLLLQVERRQNGRMKDLLRRIITNYFDDLLKNHWNKLQQTLHLSDEEKEEVRGEVRKLNPKPGAALGEAQGVNIHQVTPDFIIETTDDGQVSFTLNRGRLPDLMVSESYLETIGNLRNLSNRDKEMLPLLRHDINNARMLIDALQQRQVTLIKTMAAIIRKQKKFFLDGDEADLKPMALKDIATDTGLDIATISRVTNEKYAETQWGIFRLRFFFSDRYDNDGDAVSTRKVRSILRDIIDNEDKSHPLTDAQIEEEMRRRGYQTKRRTIVKYREQMNIPKSSLRKQ